MADNTLEAFQIGASLYDRAQTQKRMMEQLQVQTAESVLQRQGMELQNKARDFELAGAIGERQAQVDEFDTFSSVGKQVSDYLDNPKPDAKYPTIPAFKSKQYRIEADRMINNLEKYSARAELLKARDRAETTSNTLKASTINKAIDAGAWIGFNEDGSPNIDVPKMNAYFAKVGMSKIGQTEARTESLLGNLEVSRSNLQRLISEGASQSAISAAKLAYQKEKNAAQLALDRDEFGLKKETQLGNLEVSKSNLQRLISEGASQSAISAARLAYQKEKDAAQLALDREEFGYTQQKGAEEMGLKREELNLKQIRSSQLGEQIAINREKLLKSANPTQVKLNAFDNTTVNKIAMDIANKDTIAEAIKFTIDVLEDDERTDYVKINAANSIAKILNSAEGKDAVGVEEAKRLLGALDVFSVSRLMKGGKLYGVDMDSFVEQLKIKTGELDTRVLAGKKRVNAIYKKYGAPTPAGAMIGSETNSPATLGANSISEISFSSTAEARAKGKKPGDRVIINGVEGNLN